MQSEGTLKNTGGVHSSKAQSSVWLPDKICRKLDIMNRRWEKV